MLMYNPQNRPKNVQTASVTVRIHSYNFSSKNIILCFIVIIMFPCIIWITVETCYMFRRCMFSCNSPQIYAIGIDIIFSYLHFILCSISMAYMKSWKRVLLCSLIRYIWHVKKFYQCRKERKKNLLLCYFCS